MRETFDNSFTLPGFILEFTNTESFQQIANQIAEIIDESGIYLILDFHDHLKFIKFKDILFYQPVDKKYIDEDLNEIAKNLRNLTKN